MQNQYNNKNTKCFIVSTETWYRDLVPENPHIIVQIECDGGGVEGELIFEWTPNGIQLKAYNDSWNTLSKMPELINLMSTISVEGLEPTIKEFALLLTSIGFEDRTKRERTY